MVQHITLFSEKYYKQKVEYVSSSSLVTYQSLDGFDGERLEKIVNRAIYLWAEMKLCKPKPDTHIK